jgi:hypothetical protein
MRARELAENLVVVGEAALFVLREEHLPVREDVVLPAAAGDELRLDAGPLLDLRRETRGARLVVSDHAVLDRDVHGAEDATFTPPSQALHGSAHLLLGSLRMGGRTLGLLLLAAALAALSGCAKKCEGSDPKCLKTGAEETIVQPAEEPGYLVLMCQPSCDDVADEGRSLGPAPIVKAPLKPGVHHLSVKAGSAKRDLTVDIASGKTTAERVAIDSKP